MRPSTIKKPKVVSIHPSSALFKLENRRTTCCAWRWRGVRRSYQELVYTTKEYIRINSEVNISWLKDIAPHYYNSNDLQNERDKKMPKVVKRN